MRVSRLLALFGCFLLLSQGAACILSRISTLVRIDFAPGLEDKIHQILIVVYTSGDQIDFQTPQARALIDAKDAVFPSTLSEEPLKAPIKVGLDLDGRDEVQVLLVGLGPDGREVARAHVLVDTLLPGFIFDATLTPSACRPDEEEIADGILQRPCFSPGEFFVNLSNVTALAPLQIDGGGIDLIAATPPTLDLENPVPPFFMLFTNETPNENQPPFFLPAFLEPLQDETQTVSSLIPLAIAPDPEDHKNLILLAGNADSSSFSLQLRLVELFPTGLNQSILLTTAPEKQLTLSTAPQGPARMFTAPLPDGEIAIGSFVRDTRSSSSPGQSGVFFLHRFSNPPLAGNVFEEIATLDASAIDSRCSTLLDVGAEDIFLQAAAPLLSPSGALEDVLLVATGSGEPREGLSTNNVPPISGKRRFMAVVRPAVLGQGQPLCQVYDLDWNGDVLAAAVFREEGELHIAVLQTGYEDGVLKSPPTVSLLAATREGGFLDALQVLPVGFHPASLAAGDIDQDGDIDLVVGSSPLENGRSAIRVLRRKNDNERLGDEPKNVFFVEPEVPTGARKIVFSSPGQGVKPLLFLEDGSLSVWTASDE